jgi:hypothetical protein
LEHAQVDTRDADNPRELPVGDGSSRIATLKVHVRCLDFGFKDVHAHDWSLQARAVLIDMEEGVVNSLLSGVCPLYVVLAAFIAPTSGPMRDVFDSRQLITDVSGSGNNFAVGHEVG